MDVIMCYCNEPARAYVKYTNENGKLVKYQIAKCDRSLSEKKKKKCELSMCEIIESLDIPEIEKPEIAIVSKNIKNSLYTRQNLIKELYRCISIINDYHSNNREIPFEKYVNKILHISTFLNIPPYIQENMTIEEYNDLVSYSLKFPRPRKSINNSPKMPIKFIEGFDDIFCPILRRKSKKFKKTNTVKYNTQPVVSRFKVGDIASISDDDSDDEHYERAKDFDNQFDVEKFDSGDEEDVNIDDYLSD